MGTNYYWHGSICHQCKRSDEPKHIGKSSSGWCFALHVYPPDINDLVDWQLTFDGDGEIRDEYGKTISTVEMMSIITERSFNRPAGSRTFDYERNYAMPGPRGLVRSIVARNCVGHGSGTWDLIVGEFS